MAFSFLLEFQESTSAETDTQGPPTTKTAHRTEGSDYAVADGLGKTRSITEVRGEQSDDDPGARSLLAIPR